MNEARALGRWCDTHDRALSRVHLSSGIHVTGCPECVEGSGLAGIDLPGLVESLGRARVQRAERMPDEQAALAVLHDAYIRLKELGWNDATYCPKDGTTFQAIEVGSTGIHDCYCTGGWPAGGWWIDDSPSRPILFRTAPS